MHREIMKESVHVMNNDVNIVRITFVTSFFHSLIVILFLVLNINSIFAKHYENGLYIGKVAEFLVQEVNKQHVLAWVIAIAIFLFVLYSLIYPVGQAAIIYYLQKKTTVKAAIKKGIEKFFPMFEFSFISMIFSPSVYFVLLLKFYVSGLLESSGMIRFMVIYFAVMNLVNTLKVYTRYCIVIEDLSLSDSLKRSLAISSKNLITSFRYIRMQTILLITFSMNLLLLVGIPFVLLYLAIRLDIVEILLVKYAMYLMFFVMVIFAAYMSSFIRAFFAYYRYRLYLQQEKM